MTAFAQSFVSSFASLNARALVVLSLLLLGALAPAAQAQDAASMRNELNRLRQDVADLQRQMAGGSRGGSSSERPAVNTVGSETAAAQLKVQVDQMDQELRAMVGQIEQLGFQVSQVNTRLEKLVADVDFRLSALERGGAAAPLGGGAPAASPRPAQSGSLGGSDLDGGMSELPPPPGAAVSTLEGSRTPPPPPGISATLPQGSPEEQYAAAFGYLRTGDYVAAAAGMEQFIKNNPKHELAGNAVYWLGETYYVRKDYARAATYFLDGFQKYPQSRKGPDNLLKLGMTLAALEHKAEACKALAQVSKKYPQAPEKISSRAATELGRLKCG